MKKMFLIILALLFSTTAIFAAPFSPTKLTISAPAYLQYDFDGGYLNVPVTISGTPASVNFLIFSNNKASSIQAVKNGYLGWHYVNKIDTCLYFSSPASMNNGTNNLTWNGKDENNVAVPKGNYTYYLWGFDNVSVKVRASKAMDACGRWTNPPRLVQKGTDGNALANPIFWSIQQKWELGSDPEDTGLIETSSLPAPSGLGFGIYTCLQPDNYNYMFTEVGSGNKEHGIAKYKWVPNGTSELVTTWADNGLAITSATWAGGNQEAGVATDGTYLLTVTGLHDYALATAESDMRVWDIASGSLLKKIDMSPWWSNINEANNGGQMNGGPNTITSRGGNIYLNCHCSCLKQMVNPAAGMSDDADLLVWSNGNGDYVLDHNFSADSKHPWMCNDYWTGPYTWTLEPDANGFVIAPSYDVGAVSFGLLAPDGTGLGYMAFSGETAGFKYEQIIADCGSAFDGIYCDNVHIDYAPPFDPSVIGFWYIAQDSFKGVISDQVGVKEAAPAAFAVAQNSPNPFNPTTTISFTLAKAGKTTVDVYNVAGQKIDTLVNSSLSAGSHSVTWNAVKFSAGVYFYTVKCGDFSSTMKMTLLK